MPVTVESGVSGPFIPNGVTTAFAFTFKADSSSEVIVVDVDGAPLSTALYSVSLNLSEGGTVTFSTAPLLADFSQLFIVSNPAMTQASDFGNAGPSFNPASITRAFDRAAIRDLAIKADTDRTIKVPFGDVGATMPADRAGKFISFDGSGVPIASSGTGADAGLRTDLSSTTGGGFVGFLQSGTGAVAETVQAALRRFPVALEQFGGGTGVANNYAALVAAFRTGRPILLGAGTYTFSTAIDFGALNTGGSAFTAPNIVIIGDGMDRTTLRFTGAGTGLKGGRTAPATGGYAQTLHMSDLTYSGNGTGSTALGTVPNPSITFGNFTTTELNGLSGSDSTQAGIEWEMEGGCVIERCRLTKFYTPIRTKLGYGATIRNNHILGNQIGIEVGGAVTTLSITGNLIERNAIGITLWTCGGIIIENNAIQANYAGCDIYSFITNRSVTIKNNYFEASPKCFVQNGSNVDLTLRPSNFIIEGNYALEVDIVEMASGFHFRNNSIKSFAVATANISGIVVQDNRDHDDDGLSVFTDYTGTGAANIIKQDAPLIYSEVYDPTSLANGAIDSHNVTVTGVVSADFAQASLTTLIAGFNITATVVAANTVRVEIENKSGGTVDLASGTLRVRVTKS